MLGFGRRVWHVRAEVLGVEGFTVSGCKVSGLEVLGAGWGVGVQGEGWGCGVRVWGAE